MPYADPEARRAYQKAYREANKERLAQQTQAWRQAHRKMPNRRPIGTGAITDSGYKLITVDGRRVREHRYIMEQFLGRSLRPDEHIHHKDGNKLNNDLANLEIVDLVTHNLLHATFRSATHKECASCRQIKPRSEYQKVSPRKDRDDSQHDPHQARCKECCAPAARTRANKYYAEHKEEINRRRRSERAD